MREAALTQHSRPAYYDREPEKAPTHMGYTIRTTTHRYTEWRDWKTGETTARELYDHTTDPDENPNLAAHQDQTAAHQDQTAALQKHATLLATMTPIVTPGWKPVLP